MPREKLTVHAREGNVPVVDRAALLGGLTGLAHTAAALGNRGGMRMTPMEQLLEKEAIKELRIMYSHYFDGKNLDGLVDLFTDDAVCEFGPEYGGDWVGKAKIRENYARFTGGEGPEFGVLHAVTNPWIRLIDANTANGRWYLLDLRTTEGVENPLILFGVYDDVYHKRDGRWRIYRTRIDFLWPKRHFFGLRTL
jgi:hypothetical protein